MGNSPSGPRLLGNRNYYSSYDIKLGKAATIRVIKDEKSCMGPCSRLMYDVDRMTCVLSIYRPFDEGFILTVQDGHTVKSKEDSEAGSLHKRELITFIAQKGRETGLDVIPIGIGTVLKSVNFSKIRESYGGEVETQSWTYASENSKGLFFLQNKKKSNEVECYMVTIAHYLVNSASGGNFGESGVNLGFSVVVKFGVVNGKLDYSVDGPVEHPSSALLYLIEEVCQTGTWKPSACPHCKNIQSRQRRWVSDSEDSDTNLRTPPFYGGQQNTSNKGRFDGDGAGSMFRANSVNFNKWILTPSSNF
ncbi:uncharacterized protein LOC106761202 [Vigna radiata var. radiata]|uniref:Uncharacterized protein LOC106761202 n=1 Tax=Vigna radiata var. radiata TaxID=3916 RepID=A0A1S3U2J5_VIGRR|nr:uncharacterized protein LOC106761202 [Vigna radiata var. radiata]